MGANFYEKYHPNRHVGLSRQHQGTQNRMVGRLQSITGSKEHKHSVNAQPVTAFVQTVITPLLLDLHAQGTKTAQNQQHFGTSILSKYVCKSSLELIFSHMPSIPTGKHVWRDFWHMDWFLVNDDGVTLNFILRPLRHELPYMIVGGDKITLFYN